MEAYRRLTPREVDAEIKKLKSKYDNGEEDTQLYKLKLENLQTIKTLVIKGISTWQKKEQSKRLLKIEES